MMLRGIGGPFGTPVDGTWNVLPGGTAVHDPGITDVADAVTGGMIGPGVVYAPLIAEEAPAPTPTYAASGPWSGVVNQVAPWTGLTAPPAGPPDVQIIPQIPNGVTIVGGAAALLAALASMGTGL